MCGTESAKRVPNFLLFIYHFRRRNLVREKILQGKKSLKDNMDGKGLIILIDMHDFKKIDLYLTSQPDNSNEFKNVPSRRDDLMVHRLVLFSTHYLKKVSVTN